MGGFSIKADIDKGQLDSLMLWCQLMPKETKKALRSEWGKSGTKVLRKIKREQFSRSGPHSVGKGPGVVTNAPYTGKQRIHLKQAFKKKLNFYGFRKRDKGPHNAAMIFKFKDSAPVHHIHRFHEFGTGLHGGYRPLAVRGKYRGTRIGKNLPKRGLLLEARKDNDSDLNASVERAVDRVIRTF